MSKQNTPQNERARVAPIEKERAAPATIPDLVEPPAAEATPGPEPVAPPEPAPPTSGRTPWAFLRSPSAAAQLLEKARVNTKLVYADGAAIIGFPDREPVALSETDGLRKLFPVGTTITKRSAGFHIALPEGAARDLRARSEEFATLEELVYEMSALITGER